MFESRLFQKISAHSEGVSFDSIASDIFKVSSGAMNYIQNILVPVIIADKRFVITKEKRLVLSPEGELFRELYQTTFIAFDLETTGTHSKDDKITELGASKIKNGYIVDRMETLVNPGRYIPDKVSRLTGLANETVENAPAIQECMPQFLDFIGNDILIAHNASFDAHFINAALLEMGHPRLKNTILCTYKLGRRFLPGLRRYSLNTLAQYFRIVNASPHRAGSDAATCAHIFIALLNLLPERGLFTVHDLIV
jgi:DNA polymerase-3 subunit alpha (Gram-positive type)